MTPELLACPHYPSDAMASQRKVLVDVLMKCIPIRTVSESVCSIAGIQLIIFNL